MMSFYEYSFNFLQPADLNMYYCGYRKNTINHRYGPAVRDHYLLVYIEKGTATLHLEKEDLRLSSGDLLVMFKNKKIFYEVDKGIGWSIKWIGIYGSLADSYINALGITPENPVYKIENRLDTEKVLDEILLKSKRDTLSSNIECIGLLHKFFSILANQGQTVETDYIEKALNYIKFNYNLGIGVQDVAKTVRLDRSYFAKLFKSSTGLSPKEYLTRLRMEKAADLLSNSMLSVKEVAISVGLPDQLYFSRAFKEYFGESPSVYRKKLTL